jgi:cephalosporin hydroxylase
MGIQTAKCPLDLWIFQEIITETKPDLIIEAGTHMGGSALFLASVCDLFDRGEVVTIDITELPDRPQHPRITYLLGSSMDDGVVAEVKRRAATAERVMLILDSDHTEAHVYKELSLLGPLVTPGCYLIVEDTIVNGNPVLPDFGPGPAEGLARYLALEPSLFTSPSTRGDIYAELTLRPSDCPVALRTCPACPRACPLGGP